jgi:hypothetical protein
MEIKTIEDSGFEMKLNALQGGDDHQLDEKGT